ncbi:MAG: hypothetical protein IKS97_06690 [Fibrobacter sp.]|nr:hypothetical protein [Fibrobacter sp.]
MILFSSIHKNRHVHHNGFGAVIAVLTSLIILACGDDSVENVTQVMQGDVQIISEVSELPKCAVENEGELFFVKNESSMRVCSEGKWYATMLPIMASCTTAKLADETGVKILCGGDSVGVVLNGKDGKNGLDGKDGKDGADGKDGVQGAQGEKGDVGATGEKGDKGDKGDSGVAGKDGADGRDGNGCTVVTLTDNSGLKVLCGGDSVGVVLNGKDGAQGEKGDKGDTGEKGDKGDTGATGKQGDKGDKGDYGASGTGCSLTQEGTVVTITCGDKSSTLDMGSESDSVGGMKPVVLDSEKIAVSLDEVSGVTQKGPFLMGSRVLVREMEDGRTLTQTGNSFNGKILNDKGEFKINARMLVSQYVMLEASGYYRNEITGENSNSELTLFAITDVNYRNIVNVNLLTHLEYERVIYLVTKKKMKVQEAKRQAQKEILGILDIDATDFSNSEDLNIAGASNEDGALLALSVLFQGDRSVSQLSELLTKISIDMEEDGEWNDTKTKIAIADWAAAGDSSNRFTSIRNNVASWKLSSVVPNFEKHIRHFWNVEYGLNDCSKERLGEVIAASAGKAKGTNTRFICVDSSGIGHMWRIATDHDKDTYKWTAGKDGDSKLGNINTKLCYVYEDSVWRLGNTSDCSLKLRGCTALRQDTVGLGSDNVWHICDSKSWRNATTYEKDTFGWKNGTDGEIKKGNVTDTVYVFDKTSWRATSAVEGKLGGCVEAIADSVGKVGSTYYICKSGVWATATVLEYDTYKWSVGKDGDSKSGSVNANNCYVYENKAWRRGNSNDCSLGLRGCTALRQDTVGKGSDKVWHICDSKSWRNATTYEKDTFGWKNGTDGEIKKGNVTDTVYVFDKTSWRATSAVEGKLGGCVEAIADSVGKVGSTYYICKSGSWRTATALEYDTYKWSAGKDGDSKSGSVNANNCYVYENKAWRSGNASDCSLSLRGCTALRQDTVGKGSDKMWYICDSKSWRNATTFEKDTFGWKKGTDGEIKKGNVTDSIYVFDKTAWRATTNVEAKLGGCVAAIADSVGKVGSSYYICKSGAWITAAALEYDTYRWSAGKDGDSRVGSVNAANCYVYENSAWRNGNATDCSLGLRGCTALRQDTVGKGSDKMWYICDSKSWRNATNIEMDTATWGAGKFDGEVRVGQVNKSVYYIYETSKKSWRNATTLEKDTYDFTNNKKWPTGTDGEIKKGSITDSIYVYDATVWRTADNIEKVLGGCVTAIADSVGKVGSTYYICTPRKWNIATALQYDTYKKECLTDGSIVDGNVISPNKYVCDDGVFRLATENDLRAELGCTNYTRGEYRILSGQYSYYKCEIDGWIFTTEKLNQGIMTDERDGKEYKTIGIGPQMWMAENLNYADENNYPSMKDRNQCYNDDCVKYGRLYIWSAVIDSVYWAQRNKKCGYEEDVCGLPDIVQGICPDKWHVPNSNEWLTLYATMNNNARAMQAKGYSNWKKATDEYGFSALPIPYVCDAGIWCSDESSYVEGGYGLNWCIEKETARLFYHYDDHRYLYYSVRCVKD